jgi:hypothetical protein
VWLTWYCRAALEVGFCTCPLVRATNLLLTRSRAKSETHYDVVKMCPVTRFETRKGDGLEPRSLYIDSAFVLDYSGQLRSVPQVNRLACRNDVSDARVASMNAYLLYHSNELILHRTCLQDSS